MKKLFLMILFLIVSLSNLSYAIYFEEAIPQEPDILNDARESVEDGKWNLTKKYGEELIKKYPNAYPGYILLGIALDEKGKHIKAIEYYQKALQFAPNNDDIYQNMGFAYLHMKDYPNAIKYYKKALELDPNDEYANEQIQKAYAAYKDGSIRDIPITKIDDNHFMAKKEDIVRSFYIHFGQSLVGEDVAKPIEKELVALIKKLTSCKYISSNKSEIKEDIYFEGNSWDNAVGSWTEHWEIFNACANLWIEPIYYIAPVKFIYEKGKISSSYNPDEIYLQYHKDSLNNNK